MLTIITILIKAIHFSVSGIHSPQYYLKMQYISSDLYISGGMGGGDGKGEKGTI